MGLLASFRRIISGPEPTLIDYENSDAGQAASAPDAAPTGLGAYSMPESTPGTYKIQQSYDSLLETVRDLREALDGQQKRQDELLSRLSALPQAAEALPQTSKMQSDMLKMINERLSMHAEQQRKVGAVLNTLGKSKVENPEALESIKEQIEMGNEIDRQLVESFNRFSMMIDRLHIANNHAVEALQQVRDSYSHTAMQMQEWIEKSRHRNKWILGICFVMSLSSFTAVIVLLYILAQNANH